MRYDIEERRSLIARRIAAFVIDHIAITVISLIYGLIFMEQINNAYGTDLIIYTVPFFFIALLFYLFKDSIKGKSIGKRLLGLQVRSSKNIEKIPPQWKLVLRNITTPFWIIEILFLIFNKHCMKTGDIIFGTTVVIEKEKSGYEN
jgi:uncharacterized RDD family membrane protein YckC